MLVYWRYADLRHKREWSRERGEQEEEESRNEKLTTFDVNDNSRNARGNGGDNPVTHLLLNAVGSVVNGNGWSSEAVGSRAVHLI
jgi:hypothetical protein